MEFLMELILEIFAEGALDLADDKTVPRWLRITALAVATVFFMVFTVLLIIIFVECENVFFRILMGGCILFLVGMLGRFWYRLYKRQ